MSRYIEAAHRIHPNGNLDSEKGRRVEQGRLARRPNADVRTDAIIVRSSPSAMRVRAAARLALSKQNAPG